MSLLSEAFRLNHCYETGGDRWRLWIGDLAYWNENEGGCRVGPQLSFEIGFGDHVGDFDEDTHPMRRQEDGQLRGVFNPEARKFLTRWISVTIGRWGFSISWRGSEIAGDWEVPRWKLDRHGQLLEDWR